MLLNHHCFECPDSIFSLKRFLGINLESRFFSEIIQQCPSLLKVSNMLKRGNCIYITIMWKRDIARKIV